MELDTGEVQSVIKGSEEKSSVEGIEKRTYYDPISSIKFRVLLE